MSSFVPLNITRDPSILKHELEEEHTRELQIESAFKMFQKALDLQRQKKYVESYNIYDELFKLDVIGSHYYEEEDYLRGLQNGGMNYNVDEMAYLSPTIKSLRYLVLRNRGFLYFDMLKSGTTNIETGDTSNKEGTIINKKKELFYTMIEDMCASLVYQEADEGLLEKLYKIFIFLDNKRLARFTLEYNLTGRIESDDLLGLMPIDKNIQHNYKMLIGRLHQKDNINTKEVSIIQNELSFLEFIKADFNEQILKNEKLATLHPSFECKKSEICWSAVVESINLQLKRCQDKNKFQDVPKSKFKFLEPYYLTETTIERVIFKLPTEFESDEIQIHSTIVENIDDNRNDNVINSNTNDNNNGNGSIVNNKDNQDEQDNLVNIEDSNININYEESFLPISVIEENNSDVIKAEADSKANIVTQRSSKRFKPRNEGISYEAIEYQLKKIDFLETQKFFEALNEYFTGLKMNETPFLSNIINLYLVTEGEPDQDVYIQDYLKILNDWNPSFSTSMIVSHKSSGSSSDDRVKLLDVLKTFGNKSRVEPNGDIQLLSDVENSDTIHYFLTQLNSKPLTYIDVKFNILKHLLAYKIDKSTNEYSCLIEEVLWESTLFEKITDWVLEFDLIVLNQIKQLDFSIENYSFAVSIFEILVDAYVDFRNQINKSVTENSKKGGNKGNKVSVNTLCVEMSKLGDKINRWISFFDIYHANIPNSEVGKKCFLNLSCRYMWVNIYREKSKNDDWLENNHVILQLESLLNKIIKYDSNIHLALPNYRNINEINCKSIKSQLTTCHVLTMFAKLICSESEIINTDAISLLESILFEDKAKKTGFDDHVIDHTTLQSIKKFLEKSSIDMKLSLWNILFSYYDSEVIRYKYGFEKSLEFILLYVKSEIYIKKSTNYRYDELVKIFGYVGTIVSGYVRLLKNNNWKIPESSNFNTEYSFNFQNILVFFELLYLFSIHEEAALLTSNKVSVKTRSIKAYDYFKDLFIEITCLLVIYYKNALFLGNNIKNEEKYRSFLSLIHEQLGLRRLCDSSKGFFLNLLQDNFTEMEIDIENDLSQVIMCRYHYKLNVKNFTPIDHETSYIDTVDKSSVQSLSSFVLPLCFKKNPLSNIPKHDMKQIIDDFYEVIGDPDIEKSKSLKKNSSIIDSFLDTTMIKPKLLRDSFYGLASLDICTISPENQPIKDGLYYLQGLLIFSSYKIRKKNMQSRAVELENVIKLLKNDLIYSNNRIESWLLLGQAYGYSVEDDLIWTSDKLTIPERKIVTANLQRKSILCYLMAINESSQIKDSDKDYVKPVISILTSSFSKEMYSACMQPMDMHAFKVYGYPKLVRSSAGVELMNISKNSPVTKQLCLKIMQQSLFVAIKINPNDWTNYYYLSKVQRKLEKNPSEILSTLNKASLLARETQLADTIIEPHYILCSMLYKYVKNEKITINEAISYLEKDPVIRYKRPTDRDFSKVEFYQVIVDSLKKINSCDKKKWHHKPRYRLAKILDEEFGKSIEALEEMSSFVSLKASNKTLVSIWKPENERPGKHFCYTYQYAQFYLEILAKQSNLTGLVQMLPKLRRSNATMVSLYNAWENLCSSICKLIRSSLDVDENFTENVMQSLTFQEFSQESKNMMDIMKEKGIPSSLEAHLCYLHAVNDMKKFNNGFGPTSLIDDTLVAIYLRIYFHFDKETNKIEQNKAVVESPSNKIKKLPKRHVFPFAIDILKNFKKKIEQILKEKPNIYNDYLSEMNEKNTRVDNSSTIKDDLGKFKTPPPKESLEFTSDTRFSIDSGEIQYLDCAISHTTKDKDGTIKSNTNKSVSRTESTILHNFENGEISSSINEESNFISNKIGSSPNYINELNSKHKIDELENNLLKKTKLDNSDKESELFVDCVENFN